MNPVHAASRTTLRPAALAAGSPRDPRAELRRLADGLQSVFLNQLFQAMRASVHEGEGPGADPGRQLFTQLLDERVAAEASTRMRSGVGEALYRQLEARLAPPDTTETK